MDAILVTPHDKLEFKLITELLNKMRIGVKIISDKQKEDVGMAFLMSEADRSKKVSRATIMKKLKE